MVGLKYLNNFEIWSHHRRAKGRLDAYFGLPAFFARYPLSLLLVTTTAAYGAQWSRYSQRITGCLLWVHARGPVVGVGVSAALIESRAMRHSSIRAVCAPTNHS
jgi:hypothetical protein